MKFEDLQFIRLTDPSQFSLIPRQLFEQVKGSDFKIERLYQFGPVALASPLTFLYVLAEKDTAIIKGILWAEVNVFNENLIAHIFSIDKDYQGDGAMEAAIEKLKEIQINEKLQGNITSTTTRPKAVGKAGWKRSKQIVMEINHG